MIKTLKIKDPHDFLTQVVTYFAKKDVKKNRLRISLSCIEGTTPRSICFFDGEINYLFELEEER